MNDFVPMVRAHLIPHIYPDEDSKGKQLFSLFLYPYIYVKDIMGNSIPIAYNTGPLISGTTQIGNFAVGVGNQDYSRNPGGVTWWMGPNQDLGYVIARPVSGNTQPTPIFGVTASVGFYRTKSLTDNAFIGLSEYVSSKNGTPQTFSTGNQASAWLTNNGYWNSWSGVTNNVILEGFYSPGSVNAGYLVTSQYPLTADMDINFNNVLNTISGAPLVISGSVTILSGSTTGYTQLYVNYDYNNLTEESSFEDLSFITTGNTDFGFSSEVSGATFNVTPTPTPSVTPRVTPSVTTTNTPTNTQTPTNTRTPTNTPTVTRTPSVTKTPTPTQTPTKTGTPTVTKTPTPTPTKPVAGLVAGYTIYLNPNSYTGATGNIGASAVTWPDSSANGYNASVIPVANTRVNYEKSGSLSYFQFNGTQTLFNNGQGTGTVSIPTFPTDNISANAIGWNSSGQATNTFTVSSWFYTTGQNSSAGGTMGMWQKLNSMDVRTQYTYGGYQLRLGRNSNIADFVVGTTYWVTGAWNNMTMVVTGVLNTGVSSLKLYSNGVLVQTLTPNRSTTTNIGVGSTASTPMMFLTSNDNVFAYPVRYGQQLLYNNIALTDAQVLQNYNYQKTIYGL